MTDSSARGAVERYARRDRSKRDGPGQTGSARSRSVRDGRRGTSQSCVGQRDRADHPSCEGRLGRRRIVRGDAGKPQLPGMVQSRQGGTCCPGRCDRLGVEGECGRTGVALVGRGSADEARAVQSTRGGVAVNPRGFAVNPRGFAVNSKGKCGRYQWFRSRARPEFRHAARREREESDY